MHQLKYSSSAWNKQENEGANAAVLKPIKSLGN